MCLALQKGEKAYCIDVFDAQYLNKDRSGLGDRVVFERNMAQFRIDLINVTIDARSSQNVAPQDIIEAVGPVRFFSVDGGHYQEIVENDLKLAEVCLSDSGVIALDDFHRPEWPDVSAGYFSWYAARTNPIVPFAIGFNKLYLCYEQFVDNYKCALVANSFLTNFRSKNVEFQNVQVPVYQHYVLPEEDLRSRLISYAKIFNPDLYVKAKNLRRKRRR
jgi:hypothetical protein